MPRVRQVDRLSARPIIGTITPASSLEDSTSVSLTEAAESPANAEVKRRVRTPKVKMHVYYNSKVERIGFNFQFLLTFMKLLIFI